MKSLFLSIFCLFSALCVGAQTLAPFDRSHLATFGLNNPADTTLRYAPEVASTNTAIEQPLFPTLANMVPYRIPAIAVTPKGRLIAVSDYRPCGADIGFGRVDLRYRLSNDNGGTWTPQYVLTQGDGVQGSRKCGYGDAAIVADRKSNEVVVVCVTGNTVYGHTTTTRQNPNRVAVIHSTDGGRTWSHPAEITESIYGLFDQSQLGPVQSLSSAVDAFVRAVASKWANTTDFMLRSVLVQGATAWFIPTTSDAHGILSAPSTLRLRQRVTNPRWRNCLMAMWCCRVVLMVDDSSMCFTICRTSMAQVRGKTMLFIRQKCPMG